MQIFVGHNVSLLYYACSQYYFCLHITLFPSSFGEECCITTQKNGSGKFSLKKRPTFHDPTTGFLAKWRLWNGRRNSILMTWHYSDLASAFDWLCRKRNLLQPIRSTTQSWKVTRHYYKISAVFRQTSFHEETSGGIAKCRLFSQAPINCACDESPSALSGLRSKYIYRLMTKR